MAVLNSGMAVLVRLPRPLASGGISTARTPRLNAPNINVPANHRAERRIVAYMVMSSCLDAA